LTGQGNFGGHAPDQVSSSGSSTFSILIAFTMLPFAEISALFAHVICRAIIRSFSADASPASPVITTLNRPASFSTWNPMPRVAMNLIGADPVVLNHDLVAGFRLHQDDAGQGVPAVHPAAVGGVVDVGLSQLLLYRLFLGFQLRLFLFPACPRPVLPGFEVAQGWTPVDGESVSQGEGFPAVRAMGNGLLR
jgi:hypothetical protein